LAVLLAWLAAGGAAAADEPVIRIAILHFGTVSWELETIAQHRLDAEEGFRIETVELASNPATQVALQAGRVDAIVSDWLWVSRQRAEGADWTFFPFSSAVGALMVPEASPIRSLADLRGKRLGIAGSTIDKSWLVLRLLAAQQGAIDLDRDTEKSFAAPPLLDQELAAGRLDAVLTFWQFAARLEAAGNRPVLSVGDALKSLGFATAVPLVGYVVSERWAAEHADLLARFDRASRKAKALLASSDAEWERLAPHTGAESAAELQRLRDGFRAGIPAHWGAAEREEAGRLYLLLAKIGGPALVGTSPALQPGTFLDQIRY
jgi:NitT/TauT family transport system substrate-binding protein